MSPVHQAVTRRTRDRKSAPCARAGLTRERAVPRPRTPARFARLYRPRSRGLGAQRASAIEDIRGQTLGHVTRVALGRSRIRWGVGRASMCVPLTQTLLQAASPLPTARAMPGILAPTVQLARRVRRAPSRRHRGARHAQNVRRTHSRRRPALMTALARAIRDIPASTVTHVRLASSRTRQAVSHAQTALRRLTRQRAARR